MKKDQVKVGAVYAAKVSDKVVPVRIDREHASGGWVGTNQNTGKEVRIKSAQRLRGPWRPARTVRAQKTVKVGDHMLLGDAEVEVLEVDSASDEAAATVRRLADGHTIKAVPVEDLRPAGNAPVRDTGLPSEAQGAKGGAKGEEKAEAKPKRAHGKKSAPRANVGADGAERLSCLDAVARVLAEAGEPLSAKEMTERALAKSYWHTNGRTPASTTYAAIIREIGAKGEGSRFRKVARGRFELVR